MAALWPMMHFGKIADFTESSHDNLIKFKRAVSSYKTVQGLLDIADSFTTLPNEDIKEILCQSIKKSGNGISETFFNQPSASAKFGDRDFTALRNEIAVDLVSIDLTSVAKFNFNKTTNGNLAKSKLEASVNSNTGRDMGNALLEELLKRKHGFNLYLSDKKKWVQKLENILEDEVYIVGTVVKQLSEEKSLPVKMKLFFLYVLGSQKVKDIQQKWISLSSQKLIDPIVQFVHKENRLLLVNGWLMSRPFSQMVVNACFKSHTKSWTTLDPPIVLPGTIPMTEDHTEISYGDAVRNWLFSPEGPSKYGLLVPGQKPDNIVKKSHVNSPASCFLGETLILLSNSTSVPIETLKEKDQIFGHNGGIGTVSSEKVVHELDNETAIFGFNGVEPFFTSGHPFWTQDGWRAINPHLAKSENHWLEVGQLTEGDYVRKVINVNNGQLSYEWVKIDSIHFKDYPAGTRVYGVHNREGPRSYHANGYLVCLNYPEITTHNVAERMDSLSVNEKRTLQQHMDELEPVLTKVFGNGPASAMKSITKSYVTKRIEPERKVNIDKVPMKELSLPHINLQYQAGGTALGAYSMPKKMSIVRGHLFLDDSHVPDAQMSGDNSVSWTRDVPDGKWEHGSVKLHGNRYQGHGFVALTSNRNDTKSELSANFIAAPHFNKYKCFRSSEVKMKSGSQTISKWIDFGELEMGVDCSSGSCKTVGKILIPPMDTLDDLGSHVIFAVDAKQQLTVNVPIPTDFWSYLGYTKLSGTFSMDFASFSGTCVAYDATKSDLQGDTYAWKGTIETSLAADALLKTARSASLKSNIHACVPSSVNEFQSQSVDSVDGSTQGDTVSSSAAPMAMTMAAMTNQHLSVDELYMITPPDPQAVHELTFSLLQQGMKYEMDSDLREKILGVVKPTLSGDMAAVANTYKNFLAKDFANAYLMNGLAQSVHYKEKITDEQRNKLLYYWVGNDKGCLSQSTDYNNANNHVSRIAYIQSCPDVQKYLNASEGGSYWAKQLYDKLNQTEVLNGLALAAEVSQTMTIIQKQSMVLFCLSPSEDYGAKFYKKIMMTRLNEMTSYFDGSKDSAEVMKEIFTDSIHQLVLKILSGGDATTKEVTANLSKELNAAAEDLNIDMTKTEEEIASDVASHFESFISEVINLYTLKSGTAWDKLVSSVKEWRENNPIKAGVAKFFGVSICSALWIASIYFTIKTFMDWKDLEPQQKVALIADSVDIALRTFSGIPDFIENFKTSCKNGKIGFKFIKDKIKARNEPHAVEEIEQGVEKNVEEIEHVDQSGVDSSIAEATASQLDDVEAMTSNWQKMFAITEEFAKVTGLIAGVAGCVVVGFQIANDFKTDAPVAQKALDICQGITLGVATIAAGVGLFVEAACIPIIGIVCAIIGLALAIASMFIHRDPPKPKPTAIDLYVQGAGGTFANNLKAPSTKWLSDYHKKHPST